MPSVVKSQRTYCLDTGPLLDYFLLAHSERRKHRAQVQIDYHEGKCIKYPWQFDAFKKFLDRQRRLLTAIGVFVELDRHVRDRKRDVEDFRGFLQEQFSSLRFVELSVPVAQMKPSELRDFGPVDASLMHIVRQGKDEKVTLVTGDSKLRAACVKSHLDCLEFHEFLTRELD